MMDANDNPPAFPTEWSNGLEPGEPMQTGPHAAQYPGMTLLDYFAAQALAGLLATGGGALYTTPALAYRYAEAMIKTREKHK